MLPFFSLAAAVLSLFASHAAGNNVTTDPFRLLTVTDDGEFKHWALVNYKIAAGTYAIQIQRPTAFQSDVSHLEDGVLYWHLPNGNMTSVVPDVEEGEVGRLLSSVDKCSNGFSVNDDNYLEYNGDSTVFWGCPVDNFLNLYYGVDVEEDELPSDICREFQLLVTHLGLE